MFCCLLDACSGFKQYLKLSLIGFDKNSKLFNTGLKEIKMDIAFDFEKSRGKT